MSGSGPKIGVTGPSVSTSEKGYGFSMKSFSVFGQMFGHKREVRGPNVDVEGSLTKDSGRLSMQMNLFDISHTTPKGNQGSFSVGIGGEVGFQHLPEQRKTKVTVAPFGKGKTGGTFHVSDDFVESINKRMEHSQQPGGHDWWG